MNVEMADGFFAALICGEHPGMVWASDPIGGETGWRGKAEIRSSSNSRGYWNIAAGVLHSGEPFLSYLLEDDERPAFGGKADLTFVAVVGESDPFRAFSSISGAANCFTGRA
jgi:hypothetical protein